MLPCPILRSIAVISLDLCSAPSLYPAHQRGDGKASKEADSTRPLNEGFRGIRFTEPLPKVLDPPTSRGFACDAIFGARSDRGIPFQERNALSSSH